MRVAQALRAVLAALVPLALATLILSGRAMAQDEAHEPPGFDPDAAHDAATASATQAETEAADEVSEPERDCAERWGCWELLHTVKGTVLGVRATTTYVAKKGTDALAAGFVASYRTEHYATHEHLAVHFVGAGSLGGGSAGNEGALSLGLDFGYRADVSERSGPFLRAGMNGILLGNQNLYLATFEPLQARVGYQALDPKLLIEVGVTQGLIPVGTYQPGENGRRSLARSSELGGYGALHVASLRFDASFMHLFADDANRRGDLDLVRAAFCDYKLPVTVCIDALLMRGKAVFPERGLRTTNAFYGGLTLGFSP